VLALFQLPLDLIEFSREFTCLNIDLEVADVAADFEKLHDIGGVALNSLNAHVVVHALLHECALCEVL